jgi:hypothetical protein
MRNIVLARLDLHLVNLPLACQCEQSSSCDVCVAPVSQPQLDIVLGLQAQRVPGPSKQGVPLADDPVLPSIQVHRDDAGNGRLGGDERRDGACRRDFLVEEGDADGGSPEGFEQGEGREGVFRLSAEADQGSAAGVERLRGRERDGEEREGRADDFEAGVYAHVSHGMRLAVCVVPTRRGCEHRIGVDIDLRLQRRLTRRARRMHVDASRGHGRPARCSHGTCARRKGPRGRGSRS